MDKQINKIKRSEEKIQKNVRKGIRDTDTLLKMDKKFDKKLEMCSKMKKKNK